MIRAGRVQDGAHRQIEQRMHARQAGETCGGDSGAMVGIPATDDLLLLGKAPQIVVVPDELQLGLVGIASRSAEEDPRHRNRCAPQQSFRAWYRKNRRGGAR